MGMATLTLAMAEAADCVDITTEMAVPAVVADVYIYGELFIASTREMRKDLSQNYHEKSRENTDKRLRGS